MEKNGENNIKNLENNITSQKKEVKEKRNRKLKNIKKLSQKKPKISKIPSKLNSPKKYSSSRIGTNGKYRKTKKRYYRPKINVIFDIDETLIHSKSVEIPENGDKYLQQIEKDKKDIMFINLGGNHVYIVYKRPFYKQLLNYCYKKFNVSFWTAGTPPYCVGVLKKLLTPEQFNKTHIMFSRKDTKSTYDCKKNYLIKHKSVNGHYPKLLHILWHHPNYKTKFTPNNTILLDNSSVHTSRYPKNTLKVPDFYPSKKEFDNTNSNDIYLRKLLNWLKKHRLVSRVNKLTQSRHLI